MCFPWSWFHQPLKLFVYTLLRESYLLLKDELSCNRGGIDCVVLRLHNPAQGMCSPSKGLHNPLKWLNCPLKWLNTLSKGLNIPSKRLTNPSSLEFLERNELHELWIRDFCAIWVAQWCNRSDCRFCSTLLNVVLKFEFIALISSASQATLGTFIRCMFRKVCLSIVEEYTQNPRYLRTRL